jgi:hypothetical protein
MPTIVLSCSIANARDVLWAAHRGTLSSRGNLEVTDSDRLAPVIELAMSRHANPEKFSKVAFKGPIFHRVLEAIEHRRSSGAKYNETLGVFPLRLVSQGRAGEEAYNQWRMRFQNTAVGVGFSKEFARSLAGVLGELVDNVFEHSVDSSVSIAAFLAHPDSIEFVVADNGVGALGSLRQNPTFGALADSAAALRAIVFDGASRHPAESGHGEGIRQLFRALVGRSGDLGFRSGDHALLLGSEGLVDRGRLELRSEATLPGFSVSVLCQLSRVAPASIE